MISKHMYGKKYIFINIINQTRITKTSRFFGKFNKITYESKNAIKNILAEKNNTQNWPREKNIKLLRAKEQQRVIALLPAVSGIAFLISFFYIFFLLSEKCIALLLWPKIRWFLAISVSYDVWFDDSAARSHQKQLQVVQYRTLKTIFQLPWRNPTTSTSMIG